MAEGFFQLGEMLAGGGIDREGAFLEGLDTGSQINLRNAQTRNALAQARQRVQQAEATAQLGDALEAAGMDRELAPLLAGGFGSDFSSVKSGLETQQGIDFRNVLADPNRSVAERQGAGLALRGDPVTSKDVFGPGGELSLPDLFSGTFDPSVTPTGRAQIGADEALAVNRLASAALSDEKRVNPERFRTSKATGTQTNSEKLLEAAQPTSIIPDDLISEEAFGAEAFFKGGVNAVTDFFGGGAIFEDEALANTIARELTARIGIAMRNDVPGGRPPAQVQELIMRYAEDPRQLFRGDEKARLNLTSTLNSLKRSQRAVRAFFDTGEGTPTRRGKLQDSIVSYQGLINDIEKILAQFERTRGQASGDLGDDILGESLAGTQTTPGGIQFTIEE